MTPAKAALTVSMSEYDDLPFEQPGSAGPSLTGAEGRRKCYRHKWQPVPPGSLLDGVALEWCRRCRTPKDEVRSRRGRQSRNYGNRAELSAARRYGGEKIGAAGGPVDIRGVDWNVQVKTHRRLPPAEWRKAFQAMAGKGERYPRLLLRFLPGPGLPPDDYMVIPGNVWLDWFGRDEDVAQRDGVEP